MGFFGLFGKRRRERVIRADYATRPQAEWTDDEYDHWFANLSDDEHWAEWEAWSRETEVHPVVKAVKRSVIEMAREAAKASFPQEFGCFMRMQKGMLTELVLIPGTIQGDSHAIFQMHMLPVDRTINGSLHSHPSPHPYPSDADFELFEKYGMVHIILGHPFGPDDWRAYDHTGVPTKLEVVD